VRVVPMPEATARLAAERHDNLDLLDSVLERRGPAELAVIARFLGEIVAGYDEGSAGTSRPGTDPRRDEQVRRAPLPGVDPAGSDPR